MNERGARMDDVARNGVAGRTASVLQTTRHRGERIVWVASLLAASTLIASPARLQAQSTPPATTSVPSAQPSGLSLGLVLDAGFASQALALGERERGFGLGHTELSASGQADDWFRAQATAALHAHDGATEVELEEAWIESLALPAGLSLRAGRFLSQIGYLNGQHPHADDFVERPLLYRALLGQHYFDDGVRLNWVLPTALYWQVGIEALSGRMLIPESTNTPALGAFTVGTRLGGDIGISQSWQVGLGYLRNRRDAVVEEEETGGAVDEHEHEHGAGYNGRNMVIVDAVWKWAPDGNNRNRQLRLSAEFARVSEINEFASDSDRHQAWYVSAVYRFDPQWEAGLRHGRLEVSAPHDDHFHRGEIAETSLMLTWKRSHYSAWRIQFTNQEDHGDFPDATRSVMLQYVMSLGAHGAHAF